MQEKVIDKDYVVAANAVKSLRRAYGETQYAHVRLPAEVSRKVSNEKRQGSHWPGELLNMRNQRAS